ncbi:MAG: sulfur carrier protein ThiS [Endomicrobium sp.]|jgi:sulfur carrier protein|nr:sulfur carrier protein ThiS [Endomicrobium sp.]
MITVKLNGKEKQAKEAITVAAFLMENGIDPYQTAAELNFEALNPQELPKTILKDGDILEVLRFVGGG